ERRCVNEEESILHPRLVVMTGREEACHRHANSLCQLCAEVQVCNGVVESMTNLNELVGIRGLAIGSRDHLGIRGIAVIESLELLSECSSEIDLESGEGDAFILRGLENVQPTLV